MTKRGVERITLLGWLYSYVQYTIATVKKHKLFFSTEYLVYTLFQKGLHVISASVWQEIDHDHCVHTAFSEISSVETRFSERPVRARTVGFRE